MNASLPSVLPSIRLYGPVNQGMLDEFFRQQAEAPTEQPIVFELSTSGGEADSGRRLAQEIRQWRQKRADLYFLGKTFVYSAGVTILAAFEHRCRFLTRDCELLIHERRLSKNVRLDGSLGACANQVRSILAEIHAGERLENEGFQELIQGSSMNLEDLQKRVRECDWYMPAEEAMKLALVAGLVD